MARQEIILGAPPQGLGGDPPRTASMKINAMTDELYAATGALVKVASPTDINPGRLVTPGWMGLGASPIVMTNSASADTLPAINARFVFGNGGGNLPDSYVYIDQLTSGSGTWTRQLAYSINSDGMWERFFVSGSAAGKAWVPVYNGVNALVDPASGGLMSYTTIGGANIFKYANGLMVVMQPWGLSGILPANSTNYYNVTIPSAGFITTNYLHASANVVPQSAYDLPGAPECMMTSLTNFRLCIRMGPFAQDTYTTLKIEGRWK